jgi:ArsR family transcriptional regulator
VEVMVVTKNLAQIFKALGDETRLKIVEMLLGRELCVCEILEAFDKSQPVISHHLRTLKQAGLVHDSRDGKWIYYSLNPEAFKLVAAFIEGTKEDINIKERSSRCSPQPQ